MTMTRGLEMTLEEAAVLVRAAMVVLERNNIELSWADGNEGPASLTVFPVDAPWPYEGITVYEQSQPNSYRMSESMQGPEWDEARAALTNQLRRTTNP